MKNGIKRVALILPVCLLVTSLIFLSANNKREYKINAMSYSKPQIFTLTSNAFPTGGEIPLKYVCTKISGGKNISLPLSWSAPPSGTKSFAILMYDTHPIAKNFIHWAVSDIPNNVSGLKEGASGTIDLPFGSKELVNTFDYMGYGGPCPPSGSGKHIYKIIIYALNEANVKFNGPNTLASFIEAIKGKTLGQSETSGYFEQ